MKTKRNKQAGLKRTTFAAKQRSRAQPFTEHLIELRRRLFYCLGSVTLWAAAAYFVQQQIVAVLLRPAGSQQFIYTSPGGGLNFLVQLCIYVGVLCSVPVILYNVLKFVEPLMSEASSKFIIRGSILAGILAAAGVVFGYYFGLPSALKFLSHQFTTDQVKALITVDSYTGFVAKFLLASALIFQAPLIMLLINRIRPLKPRKLLAQERWVILVSSILGAVISPTPDIRSMLILSVPMIAAYHVGVFAVWRANRRGRRPQSLLRLLEQDAAIQAERLRNLESSIVISFNQPVFEPVPVEIPETPPDIYDEPVADQSAAEAYEPAPVAVQVDGTPEEYQEPMLVEVVPEESPDPLPASRHNPLEERPRRNYQYGSSTRQVRRRPVR